MNLVSSPSLAYDGMLSKYESPQHKKVFPLGPASLALDPGLRGSITVSVTFTQPVQRSSLG